MRLRFKPDIGARHCLGHEILRGGSAGPLSIGEEGWLGWPLRHRTWIPKILRFSPDKIGPPPNFFSNFTRRRPGLQKSLKIRNLFKSFAIRPLIWVQSNPIRTQPPRTVMCHAPSILMIFTGLNRPEGAKFHGRQWGIGANVQGSCQLLNIRLFPFLLSHFRHTYLNGSKSGGCHSAMTG